MPSGISRRTLLRTVTAAAGLAGVGTAAGCDLFGGDAPSLAEESPELVDLLTGTVALGDAYDDAIRRVPSLADQLTPPRDAHWSHAQLLAQALSAPASQPGGGTVAGNDPAGVVAALRALETQGLEAARNACLAAPDRFAPVVGVIAAARACHLEVLV